MIRDSDSRFGKGKVRLEELSVREDEAVRRGISGWRRVCLKEEGGRGESGVGKG